MSFSDKPGIIVGISACLLGEPVRYDGQHKCDQELIRVLAGRFRLQSFCPEVAIGMGVPRPPIQLQQQGGRIHAVGVDDGARDVTCKLQDVGTAFSHQYPEICGYVFKSRSPSCALHTAAIFQHSTCIADNGTGVFAEALLAAQPLLPVAEDSQLQDPQAIHDFSEKVVHYHESRQAQRINRY